MSKAWFVPLMVLALTAAACGSHRLGPAIDEAAETEVAAAQVSSAAPDAPRAPVVLPDGIHARMWSMLGPEHKLFSMSHGSIPQVWTGSPQDFVNDFTLTDARWRSRLLEALEQAEVSEIHTWYAQAGNAWMWVYIGASREDPTPIYQFWAARDLVKRGCEGGQRQATATEIGEAGYFWEKLDRVISSDQACNGAPLVTHYYGFTKGGYWVRIHAFSSLTADEAHRVARGLYQGLE